MDIKKLVVKGDQVNIAEKIEKIVYKEEIGKTNGIPKSEVDLNQLLKDIIEKSIRMMERKFTKKKEDLYNDDFTDFLRDKGYYVTDHTRSGKSKKDSGEIDIMIRDKSSTPVSIIEAFRLSSCGENNTIISSHIDKLIHDYDTAGHGRNFILVYAEAEKFEDLWEKYVKYMERLKTKKEIDTRYPLISFDDTERIICDKTGIRVGLALHEREGREVEIYHIFINMN